MENLPKCLTSTNFSICKLDDVIGHFESKQRINALKPDINNFEISGRRESLTSQSWVENNLLLSHRKKHADFMSSYDMSAFTKQFTKLEWTLVTNR
jgi:hypothetical protein